MKRMLLLNVCLELKETQAPAMIFFITCIYINFSIFVSSSVTTQNLIYISFEECLKTILKSLKI